MPAISSTPDSDRWKFTLPDGRGIAKAVAYLFPYFTDKSKWLLKTDIQSWHSWLVRQSNLLFAALALNKPE